MREDADANHIHEHVQVQDEMEESVTGYMVLLSFKRLKDEMKEFGLWVQPSLHGPARSQISAMLRLKVMRSPVN
jgi:hypothetical protein